MPLRDGRVPVVTSILDRLTGGRAAGTIGSISSATVAALSRSVEHDLEHLLNTRREEDLVPAGYPAAAASLLNYGIPDPSLYSVKSPFGQQRLRRSIETALRHFEPRLDSVSVAVECWDEAQSVLRFRVEAVLKIEPASEPVRFDTEFRLDSGQFTIQGSPQ